VHRMGFKPLIKMCRYKIYDRRYKWNFSQSHSEILILADFVDTRLAVGLYVGSKKPVASACLLQ